MLKHGQSSRIRSGVLIAWLTVMLAVLIAPTSLAQPAGGQIVFASNAFDTDGDGLVTTRDLASIFVVNPDGTGLTQVTDNTSFDLEPVWSPQGDRIAFTSRVDTNDDGVIDTLNDTASLVVINADGSGRLPLVSDTLNVTLPAWSPDGARIAFVSRRDANQDGVINSADPGAIYVVDAVGGGLRRLTPPDVDATDPTWSPDGTRIAYSGVTDTNGDGVIDKNTGDTGSIYTINVETLEITRVTEDDTSDFDPQFSPDGTRIAFVTFRRDDTGDGMITPADVASIAVINIDGTSRRQLTEDDYIDFEPRWSPDGALIAFRSYRTDTNGDGIITLQDQAGVYKVSAQGGNLVMLSDPRGSAEHPTWSPDGSMVAFHGALDLAGSGTPQFSIFTSDATITDARDRRITAVTGASAIDFQPDWSQPGRAPVAVVAEPPVEPTEEPMAVAEQPTATLPAPVDLPTLQPASTLAPADVQPTAVPEAEDPTPLPEVVAQQPTEIPTLVPTVPPAAPQPAGPMRLVYVSRTTDTTGDGFIDARDNQSLIVVNADGSNPVQITGIDTNDSNPAWSPDGQWIAYESQADITGDGAIRVDDYTGVYVVAADGSSINRVTPTNMAAFGPRWSPDSQRIVFYAADTDTDGDGFLTPRDNTSIYLVNRDGSGLLRLTTERTSDFDPDWSPVGDRLVFASRAADTSGDGMISILDNASIYVVNADGSNLTQITVNATEDQGPVWSPDGQRIAFISWTVDTNQDGFISADLDYPGVFVIDANGANLTRLTTPGIYARHPAWDPSARFVAYVVRVDEGADGVMQFNDPGYLEVSDHTGNMSMRLTDDTYGTLMPSWSPDGRLIAFHSWRDVNQDGVVRFPDTASIYTIAVDGSQRTQITDDAVSDFNPVWAR